MKHSTDLDHYKRLKTFVKETPLEPGVYLMKDEEGTIIYVGKAKILRHRLSSYFSGEKDLKTRTLLAHVRSIETIIVANEYEALLLENTLIKEHSPRYNINLKDGKTYPVLRLTNEEFPRIFKTRYIVQDGSRYFGPFPNVLALESMLDIIERLFPLRKCKHLKHRSSPCMYYHIGRCSAPCTGKITPEAYMENIEQAVQVITGETELLIQNLQYQMEKASMELRFEQAAKLRDAIQHIRDLATTNSVVDFDEASRDYIAWAEEGILATFTVFSMRGGKMTGRDLFRTRSASEIDETITQFIISYYSPDRPPPPTIFLYQPITIIEPVLHFLQDRFGTVPIFRTGDEKRHLSILAMAYQNAREDVHKRLKERGAGPALEELQRLLSLPTYPERIEGFDIAQLGGKHTVASLVSFKNGIPDTSNYRHFKIRSLAGAIDDFASIREAVFRRYKRLRDEGKELPDFILIDGGLGQVNAALTALNQLGLSIPLAGLAKKEEILWLPDAQEGLRLDRRSEALKVLQHVRDETHRFATNLNQRLRAHDLKLSTLENLPGIGPRRATHLITTFGSLANIVAAEPAAIASCLHCSLELAELVQNTARAVLSGTGSMNNTQRAYTTKEDLAAQLAAEAAEWKHQAQNTKKEGRP
ncbi:MAG: excinuclease ABC subunit UvrC [Termitinemataceae bacterium]